MSTRAASAAANAAAELAEANYSVNATIENESLDFQASYAEVMIKMGLRLDPIKFAAERSAPEQEAMFNLCKSCNFDALAIYNQCAQIEVSSGDKSTASHHGSTTTFSATMFTLPRLQAIAEILIPTKRCLKFILLTIQYVQEDSITRFHA